MATALHSIIFSKCIVLQLLILFSNINNPSNCIDISPLLPIEKSIYRKCDHVQTLDLTGCQCAPNYTLINGTENCIHQCEQCSQGCSKGKDTIKCECAAGFQHVANNEHKCEAIDRTGNILILNPSDIIVMSLDNHNITKRIGIAANNMPVSENKVAHIDFHYQRGELLWSDADHEKLHTIVMNNINYSEQNVTYESAEVKNIQLLEFKGYFAVDWIHDHIYWIAGSRFQSMIMLSDMLGQWCKMLQQFNTGTSAESYPPLPIAVDPLEHRLFWVFGTNIKKSNLEGKNDELIISESSIIRTLSLDLYKKRIYWLSADSIHSCDYDGQYRRHISSNFPHYSFEAFDFTVFEDNIYWIDQGKQKLLKMDKLIDLLGNGTLTLAGNTVDLSSKPEGIAIYHALKQPAGVNHCADHKCSHFCLPAQVDKNDSHPIASCFCPDGMDLLEDRINCVKQSSSRNETVAPESPTLTTPDLAPMMTEKVANNTSNGVPTNSGWLSATRKKYYKLAVASISLLAVLIAIVLIIVNKKTLIRFIPGNISVHFSRNQPDGDLDQILVYEKM